MVTEAIALKSQRGCPVPLQDTGGTPHLWLSYYEEKISLLEINLLIHSSCSACFHLKEDLQFSGDFTGGGVCLAFQSTPCCCSCCHWQLLQQCTSLETWISILLPLCRLWQQPTGSRSRKRGDIKLDISSWNSFHGFVGNMEKQCRICMH